MNWDAVGQYRKQWIVLLALLNVFDTSVTLYAVSNGAVEYNPLLRFLYSYHPFLMVAFKLLLVAGGVVYVFTHKSSTNVSKTIFVLTVFYCFVAAYELGYLFL